MITLFRDRHDAGRKLAEYLKAYADRLDVLVLALPRGGVPVAFEAARALRVPMDVFVVRKIGVPGHEELALGALAPGGVVLINQALAAALHIRPTEIESQVLKERQELERRIRAYRDDRPPPDIAGRTIVLVDDGLATGASMRAAIAGVRRQNPARLVVAVPTADPQVCEEFKAEADQVICAFTPDPLCAVGLWYDDFSQTTDEEVRELLQLAESHRHLEAQD
jgi:predicted phosphoribosyltransferase